MSNWSKVHCISRTYCIIWRRKSRPSKNWSSSKIAFTELCKWTPVILGMITYLGKLIPNLAEVTAPLRTLLKKEVEFKLEKPQLDVIGKLNFLVITTPCLKVFSPNLQTRLKIDVSSEWLGVLLEQNDGTLTYPEWYPVGYASRSLRDFENCYTQIKKETPSIVFGI